jgi:hypothetical protein
MQYTWQYQGPHSTSAADVVPPYGIYGETPAKEANPGFSVFVDFALLTRDKPWLKGILTLEALVLVFLAGVALVLPTDCRLPPMKVPDWLLTFAIVDLLQLWTYLLLKAKGYLPVVVGKETLQTVKNFRHGAVILFWLLSAFLLGWVIFGAYLVYYYPCPIRSDFLTTVTMVVLTGAVPYFFLARQ